MKKIFFFALMLVVAFPLMGQMDEDWFLNENLSDTLNFKFEVTTLNGKLALTKINPVDHSPFHTKIMGFDLEQSDLKFVAFPFQKKGGKSVLKIMGIRRNTEHELAPFAEENIHIQRLDAKKEGLDYRIMDVTEDFLELGATYTVDIERSFYTDFNPDIPLQKMGFIWDAGPIVLAAGGLLWGNSLKNQKEDAYQNYQNLWRAGSLQSEAQDFYTMAEKKRKDAIWVVGGAVVSAVVAEGIIWWLRSKRNKRIKLQKAIANF